jgi:hypothetical protein
VNGSVRDTVQRLEFWVATHAAVKALGLNPRDLTEGQWGDLVLALGEFRKQVNRPWPRRADEALLALGNVEALPDALLAEVEAWRPRYAQFLRDLRDEADSDSRVAKVRRLIESGATEGERDAARAALARITGAS